MNMINIQLSVEEINVLLQILGEVPTKSGIYPLLMSIKHQGDAAIKSQEGSPPPGE